MSTLGTINSIKDQAVSAMPLMLIAFTFSDSTILNVCYSPLNSTEGGYSFNGTSYLARVSKQTYEAIAALSPGGIDVVPSISISLNNADGEMWTYYEYAKGFGGASVTVDLVLMQVGRTGYTFTSDEQRRFSGICDPSSTSQDGLYLNITAVNKMNMSRRSVPPIQIQPRCPWSFPPDAASRAAAANDRTSPFWQCGYSADISGTGARGNLNGGTPYTTCSYIKSDCIARGMYTKDSANRQTGTFGGSQWAPATIYFKGKQYTSGNTVDGFDVVNSARYNDFYPLLYGQQMITDAPVMNTLGDPNSTRGEVVFNFGQSGIDRLIVNGIVTTQNNSDVLFTWRYTNDGSKFGKAQNDALYNGNGDPYGSLCAVEFVVPISLQQSSSVASVSGLARRLDVPTPNTTNPADAPSWPTGFTTNPAFIILDLLVNSGSYTYKDVDLATFISAASWCNNAITYTDNTGNAGATHERYRCAVYYRQRKPLNQAITAIRQSFNGILAPNSFSGGLLQLFVEKSLADQQPSAVSGSNYNTPISSFTAGGGTANGYAAYSFDESNILPGTLRLYQSTIAATGNRVTVSFQDKDNQFVQDSLQNVDAFAVASNGGQILDATFEVDGIDNFDQGNRISNLKHFRDLRGNPRSDPKGTIFFDFTTTVRATHLKASDIVLMSWQKLGIVNQPARVTSIGGTANWEQLKLTTRWHNDQWYIDANMQNPAQLYSQAGLQVPNRDPYPWSPAYLGLAQSYPAQDDGSVKATIGLIGTAPVNQFSPTLQPPLTPLQGTSATGTGGNIPIGTYHMAICGIDANGLYGPMSNLTTVVVTANSSTITVNNVFWPIQPTRAVVFVGLDGGALFSQREGFWSGSAPTSFTSSTALTQSVSGVGGVAVFGPPDQKFSKLKIRAKPEIHAGAWGDTCTGVSSDGRGGTNITFGDAAFTSGQFNGYTLVRTGSLSGAGEVVMQVNTTLPNGLHVSGNYAGLLSVGDVFILRAAATNITSSTIGDPNFINYADPAGLTVDGEAGNILRIVGGTGEGQTYTIQSNTATILTIVGSFSQTLDSTTQYIVEGPSWIYSNDTQPLAVSNPNPTPLPNLGSLVVSNLAGQYVVQILAEDVNGNYGFESRAPIQEIYMFGAAGNAQQANPGYFTITPDGNGNFPVDLANGFQQRILLTTFENGLGGNVLFRNPDFEDAVVTPWATTDGSADSIVSAPVHSGTSALQVTAGTGGEVVIYQDITGLNPGQKYTLYAWVAAGAGATATAFLRALDTVSSTHYDSPTVMPTATWQQLNTGCIANTAGGIRIELHRPSGGSGNLFWDDAAITGSVVLAPAYTGGTIVEGMPPVILIIDQDKTVANGGTGGYWPGPAFQSGTGAWSADFGKYALEIKGDPDTRTVYTAIYHPTVFGISSFITGTSTT